MVIVCIDGQVSGFITAMDTIKPQAKGNVLQLKKMGLEVVMLTGDNCKTAKVVAGQLGIEKVVSEVLPSGKVAEIERIMKSGHCVAMVGDGINDAPALASADVGVAMGSHKNVPIHRIHQKEYKISRCQTFPYRLKARTPYQVSGVPCKT